MSSSSFQTCKRCLYNTNHPLGLVLDEEGICSGCRVHEEKDQLDWEDRWYHLEQLVKPYRARDPRNYDCIVPVTGAGDSFFIVYLVKERLKLNPLLVTYNRYYNTPLGIRNLAQLRRCFDCDILIQSVNPFSVKKIITTTLRKFGSFQWPVLAGQSVFPVQTAVSHGVPLVIWGAHQGLEQVGMFSHLHEIEMTRRYRKDHDLMGYEADDLLDIFDTLTESDIWQYRYPDESDLEKIGVRGIYLGNYVRWDPLAQHAQMVKESGYYSAKLPRTFDIYDHVDDWHYMGMHDWIKQNKHGYGRVLDQACREIRFGRLSREHALALVHGHQNCKPPHTDLLLDWLGITEKAFNFMISVHSNFQQPLVNVNFDLSNYSLHTDLRFSASSTLKHNYNYEHITIGKGYPD